MLKRQNVFTENFTIIFPNAGKTENEQKLGDYVHITFIS